MGGVDGGSSHPVPEEEKGGHLNVYAAGLSSLKMLPFVFTFLFLAPALRGAGQLVVLLPQLAQTLPLLLQTGLQLQDQDLRTQITQTLKFTPLGAAVFGTVMKNSILPVADTTSVWRSLILTRLTS